MTDIHSIGQAFKIVSERTAKRKTSKLITDGDSTIRRSITSQEFPPQGFKKEVFEEIKLLKELKKLWQKQAREEMLRKIKRLSKDVNWWDTRAIRGSSETKETDKWICRNQFKWVLKQLVEGGKK